MVEGEGGGWSSIILGFRYTHCSSSCLESDWLMVEAGDGGWSCIILGFRFLFQYFYLTKSSRSWFGVGGTRVVVWGPLCHAQMHVSCGGPSFQTLLLLKLASFQNPKQCSMFVYYHARTLKERDIFWRDGVLVDWFDTPQPPSQTEHSQLTKCVEVCRNI